MSNEIRVRVVEFGDRKHYQLQWNDPNNGRKKTRSSNVLRPASDAGAREKKAAMKEAQAAAGKLEKELSENYLANVQRVTWERFKQRYEDEVLKTLSDSTFSMCGTIFSHVETFIAPQRLRDITADRLSHLQAKLREPKRDDGSGGLELSDASIRSYFSHLMAALAWAVDVGMLPSVPKVKLPKRQKGVKLMKGRPVTGEEFDRLLAATDKVVGQKAAESWKHLLRGLYLSGLRLGEALDLYWDQHDKITIDTTGRRPMFRILADLEKGGQDRLLPMTPDFAEFILATPPEERTGPVFSLTPRRKDKPDPRGMEHVSATITAIGKKAGVKVDTDAKGRVKHASAHDLRRAFGARWSSRVMPIILQQLMRHESIETTLRYYVGQNAEATADVVWEAAARAMGNNSGNSDVTSVQSQETKQAANH